MSCPCRILSLSDARVIYSTHQLQSFSPPQASCTGVLPVRLCAAYGLGFFFSSSLAKCLGAACTQQLPGSAPEEECFALNLRIRALSGYSLCAGVITLLWKDDNCVGVRMAFIP